MRIDAGKHLVYLAHSLSKRVYALHFANLTRHEIEQKTILLYPSTAVAEVGTNLDQGAKPFLSQQNIASLPGRKIGRISNATPVLVSACNLDSHHEELWSSFSKRNALAMNADCTLDRNWLWNVHMMHTSS